jgi:hypothetical protein
MNREKLKRLWFNIDYSNVKERKQIIVEMNKNPHWPGYGEVEIRREGPNGFSTFKTHEEFPMEYALDREEYKSGEYELIIKE